MKAMKKFSSRGEDGEAEGSLRRRRCGGRRGRWKMKRLTMEKKRKAPKTGEDVGICLGAT